MNEHLTNAILNSLGFGCVGIVLSMIGFKAFDMITPKIDVQKELADNKNMAVAIVVASLFIGIGIIAAHAIS